ncbi:MAG: phosphoglycerate mutase family protein [Muribaculaceae bacterium]|nr:phosphoglycerate mutase family protein [Muribaculaceae bacterium]
MKEYELLARQNQKRAFEILSELQIIELWESYGCKVNLIGSLAMKLLVKHLDIDLHVYSSGITEEYSFEIAAQIAKNRRVKELKCINGLHTDEHCIAWHIFYEDVDGRIWQIDIIHIESGTRYDGYFEKMAQRINEILDDEKRDRIMRLKYETPENEEIHGVEYYQAVIEDNVTSLEDLREWVKVHRNPNGVYWIPN